MAGRIRAWTGLDNAAKIFPPSQSAGDTKVFRVSCELRESVDPDALSRALSYSAADFPVFRHTIRRGAFWYYLEECDRLPAVHEEEKTPCSRMRFGQRTPLFDVSYYKNRIHLEVYHALTDGTGAMQFLRAMTAYYLKIVHPQSLADAPVETRHAAPDEQADDSFRRYYDDTQKKSAEKEQKAYQLHGLRRDEWALGVIEGDMSAQEVLHAAHAHGTTVTVYIAALFILAVGKTMIVRHKRRPVVVTVPVNLRSLFDSATTRNFFSVVNVGYTFPRQGETTLEQIIESIRGQFDVTRERMYNRLNNLSALENNPLLRIVPLRIKDWVMRAFYERSERAFTVSLSNLGRVEMPDAYAPYISAFTFLISTKKLEIGMCTFGDTMRISLTSSFQHTAVERHFFRLLAQHGVHVCVTGNREEVQSRETV